MAESKPGDTAPTPPEQKFLGITQADTVKMVAACVLGIAGTLIVNWWTSKEAHLAIRLDDTVRFKGDKSQIGINTFSVTNEGSKEADGVECSFEMEGAQEVQAYPPSLHAVVKVTGTKIEIVVPTLNRGERLQVSTLGSNASTMPDKLDVTVRGKGVVGEIRNQVRRTSDSYPIPLYIVFLVLAIMLIMPATAAYQFYKSQVESKHIRTVIK